MKTGIRHALGLAACVSLSMLAQQALAAPPGGHEPGGHVDITNVAVDSELETITIYGNAFDFGGPLLVTLGGVIKHDENNGDPLLCESHDFISSPQTIVCDLSSANNGPGLPPDGDYELIVSTGNGQSESDGYDLTIGAVGPEGLSAYEVAVVEDGFEGTEMEWLATLVGADGADGAPGADGTDGAPGADGTDGAPGADGADGAPGADGTDGLPGADGLSCWDLNENGVFDVAAEDLNGDTLASTEDCVADISNGICAMVAAAGACEDDLFDCADQAECTCTAKGTCRVFVSSTPVKGDFRTSSTLDPDALCTQLAENSTLIQGYGTSQARRFRAWYSLSNRHASDWTLAAYDDTTQIIRMDGITVATGKTDLLDGTLNAPIGVTEEGNDISNNTSLTEVWTGTYSDGNTYPAMPRCEDWRRGYPLADVDGSYGVVSATDNDWTSRFEASCNNSHRLYCFEQ